MTNLTDLEDFEVFDQEDGLIVTAYTVISAGEFSHNDDFSPSLIYVPKSILIS